MAGILMPMAFTSRARTAIRNVLLPRPEPFPSTFLFGVGTADHQCEAFDARYPDVWDLWEAQHPVRHPGQDCCVARGTATDFWRRYPEDVRLAAALGCTAFRFSIAWSRVEPEAGRFSEEALAHYRQVAETIREAGMEPVVTLLHFVWPKHVEDRGGLRAPNFPEWFAAYAARVRVTLGDLCRYWITINEPNGLPLGFLRPFWLHEHTWPPGLPAGTLDEAMMRATAEVIRNLFLAHRLARLALRSGAGGEQRLVSANSYYFGLPTHFWRLPFPLMQWVDWRATSERGWSEEDWALVEGRIVLRPGRAQTLSAAQQAGTHAGPILIGVLAALSRRLAGYFGAAKTFAVLSSFTASNWWQLGMRGRLPEFLCPRECIGQLDYVAFDYYFGTQYLGKLSALLDVIERRYDRAPIWAAGLYDAITYFARMFPDLPLFVIENGVAAIPNDPKRARYLRDHIREVQRAVQKGVNVIGYLAWSLTTNREWGLKAGAQSDFGLYHVDLDGDPELIRHSTGAARAYQAIINRRTAWASRGSVEG
jgi:beta-glucosidase/6-phospho-beta-glucosidase/beta-galactosidase